MLMDDVCDGESKPTTWGLPLSLCMSSGAVERVGLVDGGALASQAVSFVLEPTIYLSSPGNYTFCIKSSIKSSDP